MRLNSKPHTITVRLDSDLHKRLRKITYVTKQKKQPLFRLALTRFFLNFEKSNLRKQQKVIDRLLEAPRLKHPLTPERVTLDQELSGMLQWITREFDMKYQTIACAALEEYMKIIEERFPETKVYVDAHKGTR
jgi:predicted transcriptional regulator